MENNKLVAKKNVLVPEFVKLGHQEKRFLAYCISQLNPMKEKEFSRFTVTIAEIADVFGLPEKSAYSRLREAATAINSRPILTKEGKSHWMDWWFSWLHWDEGTGVIDVQFNERLVPFLLNLKREYMQYPLSMAAGFSNQAWSVYEILKQWLPVRMKHFTLDEFKDLLGLVGKYPQWFNFKRYVLAPSIKEINEKSDIKVSYVPEKQSRRVVGLTFHIDKRQADNQPDNVITITSESDQDKIQRELVACGVNHKTANIYARNIENRGRTDIIIGKLPGIVERAKKSGAGVKYILGAIKDEINQEQLFEKPPTAPTHQEALSCWIEKKHAKKTCKVREKKSPGQRKKCHICLEKLPIAELGI